MAVSQCSPSCEQTYEINAPIISGIAVSPSITLLEQNLGGLGTVLNAFSFSHWICELLYVTEMQALPPGASQTVQAQAQVLRYATDGFAYGRGIVVLIAIGIISRLASLVCLMCVARAASARRRVHCTGNDKINPLRALAKPHQPQPC